MKKATAQKKKKNNKKSSPKKNRFFTIFYIIAFTMLVVIGLLGISFFAWQFFDSLFFDALCLALLIAIFVMLSVQNYLEQTTFFGKSFSIIYFNLFALVFAITPFFGGRINAMLLFCCFILGTMLLIILAFKYKRAPELYPFKSVGLLIIFVPVLLLMMLSSKQVYVDSEYMWVPIIFCGIGLAIISLLIFIKNFINTDYFATQRGEKIAIVFIIIAVSFMISWVTVSTVNYAFDGKPTSLQAEIIDKYVTNGARTPTSFNLKIIIKDKKRIIDVPVNVYYTKEIGDTIEINLYKGALGYSYYIYEIKK